MHSQVLIRFLIAMILVLTIANLLLSDEKDVHKLIEEMIDRTKSVETIRYHTETKERINGEIIERGGIFKMIVSPPKVYYERLFPEKGAIVIYDSLKLGRKIQVKPHTFPWVPLNLHIDDWMIRKSGHHTPDRAGYGYTIGILEYLLEKYNSEFEKMLRYGEQHEYDGAMCQIVHLENPNFRWENYIVKEGETIISIAEERKLSEYMILKRNSGLKITKALKREKIKLPTDYAKAMDIWINLENLLPVKFTVYDDRGLFEEFGYKKMEINIPLDESEFELP